MVGNQDVRGQIALTLILFVVSNFITWYVTYSYYVKQINDTKSQNDELKKSNEESQKSNKELSDKLDSFRELPADVKSEAILAFRDQGFSSLKQNKVSETTNKAKSILVLDRCNGNDLYLLGEALKKQYSKGALEAFEDYLSCWPSIKSQEIGENKPKGYFDERTA